MGGGPAVMHLHCSLLSAPGLFFVAPLYLSGLMATQFTSWALAPARLMLCPMLIHAGGLSSTLPLHSGARAPPPLRA